jgi:hypothetical protein
MATGGPEPHDFHIHVVGVAADRSHDPRTFRMHCDKELAGLSRAYATFRAGEVGDDATSFRMLSPQYGDLDPSLTAASYGLADGANVVFTKLLEAGHGSCLCVCD